MQQHFQQREINLVNNRLLVTNITLRLRRLKVKGLTFDIDEGVQLRVFYNEISKIGAFDQHC